VIRSNSLKYQQNGAGFSPAALYASHKNLVEAEIQRFVPEGYPVSLYQPIRYALTAGGKRIRPVLVLLATEAVGGTTARALPAAVAMELLHTFTLIHDDIIDRADLRRGHPTIHVKWNTNTALLAGDALIALAYKSLLKTATPRLPEIASVFTKALSEVCEGQASDTEFEERMRVSFDDYISMISKKTGAFIVASLWIGALIGNGSDDEIAALRRYGEALGRAFQLQDDLLDITGSETSLGKPVGADLLEGKKTAPLIMALKRARGKEKDLLQSIVRRGKAYPREISRVKRLYEKLGVLKDIQHIIDESAREANSELLFLHESNARRTLRWLAETLARRTC